MYLIQIILPMRDNDGAPFPSELFDAVRGELVDHCGGVTASMRPPAHGVWENPQGQRPHEEMLVLEVMCERLERVWWHEYRRSLERRFEQCELMVRALQAERL